MTAMKMHYYNCKVRLHGVTTNEVQKEGVSTPEILLMRRMHGDDAVVDIKYAFTAKIDDAAERERLQLRYGAGLASIDENLNIEKLFGSEYTPLVATLKGVKLPEKLIRKSEWKAARKEAAIERAHSQDNSTHKLDEDDIDNIDEDDIDDFEDDPETTTENAAGAKEKEKAPADKPAKAAAGKAAAKPAGAVI